MAATLKVSRQYRSWENGDSFDQSDVARLFESETVKTTKPVKYGSYCSVYLALIGFFALFLTGILIGFYLRDDPQVFNKYCDEEKVRSDGLGEEKLQAVHNNIMYYMSGDGIIDYIRDLSSLSDSLSDPNWDELAARLVETEFKKFGFDRVEVEEHEVVVTYPDPEDPNRLEILHQDGSTSENVTINRKWDDRTDNIEAYPPFVAFSPPGKVQGPLLFVNHGTYLDFLLLRTSNVSLTGMVALMQMGKRPVHDKVRWAEEFGVVGVLLFCLPDTDVDDCSHGNKEYPPFTSTADFSGTTLDILVSIPVQTVSYSTAIQLLGNLPLTILPKMWRNSLQDVLVKNATLTNKDGVNTKVKLTVNNKLITKKIYNVIGILDGSEEPDRVTMVGCGRQAWPTSQLDSPSNTAMMMELAKSVTYIKNVEGWRPRRSIQISSWGGHQLSKAGLWKYIMNISHFWKQEAVTYIDLDLHKTGNDVMKSVSSPGFVDAIRNAAYMVPDPSNPDFSLADSWPEFSHVWYSSSQLPVHIYSNSHTEHPMIQQLGIPTVIIQLAQVKEAEDFARDVNHHFKFHLASVRVVSLILLKLADDTILPIDVGVYADFVNKSIVESVSYMEQIFTVSEEKREVLLDIASKFSSAGKTFSDIQNMKCASTLKLRKINDVLMRLDSIFVNKYPLARSQSYLFSPYGKNCCLSIFSDLADKYMLTKDMSPVYKMVDIVTEIIKEAIHEISSIQQTTR